MNQNSINPANLMSPDPGARRPTVRTIDQSVRDFTKRLLHLKNVEGQSAMPVIEALQWANEIQQGFDKVQNNRGPDELRAMGI